MKAILKMLLLPALLLLFILELVAKLLSRTAQIIVTEIGGILLLVVAVSAIFGIAPMPECIRNGIVIIAAVAIVNLAAVIPALLEAARTALSGKII